MDDVEHDATCLYVNDSLRFQVEYWGNYFLNSRGQKFKDKKTKFLLKRIVHPIKPPNEILVTGRSIVMHTYKTAAVAYSERNLNGFTDRIISQIQFRFKPVTLSVIKHVKDVPLEVSGWGWIDNIQNYAFNQLHYERKFLNKHLVMEEYHLLLQSGHIVRFIWWVELTKGFDKDMAIDVKIPSFHSQALHIMNTFRDNLTVK